MIRTLFSNIFTISVSTGIVIVLLLLLTPILNKRYTARWKYLIWIMIAVRLIIPFHIKTDIPRLIIRLPERITIPIGSGHSEEAPLALPPVPDPNIGATGSGSTTADPGNIDHGEIMPSDSLPDNAVPLQSARKTSSFSLPEALSYIWLAGSAFFLFIHICSFLHYKKQVLKKSRSVEDDLILQHICKLSGKLRIKPDIKILRYADAKSPMVIGFLKPLLILPDCEYTETELFFVLKHELVHIKRRDICLKLLFVTANALHWFNPLIYLMRKEAVIDMELSCDETVVAKSAPDVRKAYTETLYAAFCRQRQKSSVFTTQFYESKSVMKRRFRNILSESPKKRGLLPLICAAAVILLSGVLIGYSFFKADPQNASGAAPSFGNPVQEGTDSENLLALFRAVLLGKNDFFLAGETAQKANIADVPALFDAYDPLMKIWDFCIADLDGDGEEEVILFACGVAGDMGGRLILHKIDDRIYGYRTDYRTLTALKTDGTFEYDTWLPESGIAVISAFSETAYTTDKLCYAAENTDTHMSAYVVNRQPVTEEMFREELYRQGLKQNVTWYAFDTQTVNAVFASLTGMPQSAPQPSAPQSSALQPSMSSKELLASVLLGERDFICGDFADKRRLYIGEIGLTVTEEYPINVSSFTVLDLDYDGTDEIILKMEISESNVIAWGILHMQNGEIYEYSLPYRAFMQLKTDGSFDYSNGAADSGVGKIAFTENGYVIVKQDPLGQSGYTQDQKTDMQWYDFDTETIRSVL